MKLCKARRGPMFVWSVKEIEKHKLEEKQQHKSEDKTDFSVLKK